MRGCQETKAERVKGQAGESSLVMDVRDGMFVRSQWQEVRSDVLASTNEQEGSSHGIPKLRSAVQLQFYSSRSASIVPREHRAW
jgi:hypothetical protein